MHQALFYISLASLVLAVVLAVTRDVPILHLLMPPSSENVLIDSLPWLALLILFTLGLGVIDGIVGPGLHIFAWLGALAYFWWSVGWHLREATVSRRGVHPHASKSTHARLS
jgi:hypothetical protein